MKIQQKNCCSLGLFLLITLILATMAGATTLTEQAVREGTYGSALGGGAYTDTTSGFGTKVNSVDVYDPAGPVDYNYPPPVATTDSPWLSPLISGYADAGSLNMGAAAYTSRDNSRGALTSTFANRITVGAGGSEKDTNAPTTLTLSIRLDGATNSTASRSTTSDVRASMGSVFQLWDPTQEDPGSEYTPYLLDFSASAWNQEETSGDGSLQHTEYWQWKAERDINWYTQETLAADSGDNYYDLADNQERQCLGGLSGNCNSLFDTGLLTFEIDTYVGAELLTLGYLHAISSVIGSGSSYTGFLNTFGATLTAADGIELAFAVPPPAETGKTPVPEPSTFLLLGGGLVGLVFAVRRRRKE